MTTIKCHWNSVLSDPGAKYCTGDAGNIYLESWLSKPQYVRFKLEKISKPIKEHYYKLDKTAHNGYVYARINKA